MFRICRRLSGVRHLVSRKAINPPKVSPLVIRFNSTEGSVKHDPKLASTEESVKHDPKLASTEESVKDDPKLASTEESIKDDPKLASTEESVKHDPRLAKITAFRKKYGPAWIIFVISTIVLTTAARIIREKKRERLREQYTTQLKAFGEALIGGPFNLLDMENKPVTDTDFLGKWLLIYFGFTHCPDVCPEMLEKIASAVDILETKNPEPFVPLFISVDPERDTPKAIMSYLNEFSPKIIGLTGTMEEIKKVCKSYRIYHSQGPKDIDNDYIVDHSVFIFLMRPDGKFANMFSPSDSVDAIVDKTKTVMADYLSRQGDEIKIVAA